jgi:hypothetical protein
MPPIEFNEAENETQSLFLHRLRDQGRLREPFSSTDFLNACPDGEGTYIAFLHKHALGNKGKNTELFVRVSPGKFECVRPFKYGGK